MESPGILYCFIVLVVFSTIDAQVGNVCRLPHTGANGLCKLSPDCPQAQKHASLGINPTICGYQQRIPIVCCDPGNIQPVHVEANENSFLNIDDTSSPVQPDVITFQDETPTDPKDIASKKCEEFSNLLTDEIQVISLTAIAVPTSINITKCDYDGVPLIVGGKPAQQGEFPHMAAIGFKDVDNSIQWNCGGTLISNRYVASAAHCANSRLGPPVKVRLGVINLLKHPNTLQEFDIEHIYKHPQYNRSQKYNDIVLFKLNRDVRFTTSVRPACLWTKPSLSSSTAIATGWGRIEFGGSTSDTLLKVTLQLFSNQLCENTYRRGTKGLSRGIESTMVCAGDLEGGKDTCNGDSGGPLQITKDNNQCVFYLVGITSFGRNCAAPKTPAIYTRVSSYIDWIVNTIWQPGS